jgi:hypothetical protein
VHGARYARCCWRTPGRGAHRLSGCDTIFAARCAPTPMPPAAAAFAAATKALPQLRRQQRLDCSRARAVNRRRSAAGRGGGGRSDDFARDAMRPRLLSQRRPPAARSRLRCALPPPSRQAPLRAVVRCCIVTSAHSDTDADDESGAMQHGKPSALAGVAARVEETRRLVEAVVPSSQRLGGVTTVMLCMRWRCATASEQTETGFHVASVVAAVRRVHLACPACASHAVAGIAVCP